MANRADVITKITLLSSLEKGEVITQPFLALKAKISLGFVNVLLKLPESFIKSPLNKWKTVKDDEFTSQTAYKRRDEVTVIYGPFAGMVSKITDLSSKECVQLLFEMLEQNVPIFLPKKLTIRNC